MSEQNPLDYFDGNMSAYQEMIQTMQDRPFLEKLKATFDGITKPKDSGEYKMAKLQLQLWAAPFFAALTVATMVVLLVVFGYGAGEDDRAQIAEVMVPETVEELDDTPPEVEIEPPEVEFEPTDFSDPTPVNVNVPNPVNQPLSPKPAPSTTPPKSVPSRGSVLTGRIGSTSIRTEKRSVAIRLRKANTLPMDR